jgi:hypothetical protein
MKENLRPRAGLFYDKTFPSIAVDMMRGPTGNELCDKFLPVHIDEDANSITVG